MYERVFQVADLVTYNCEHARGRLESLGCPPHKLHQLRMPVDVGSLRFRPRHREADEPLRILTVGRLVEKKGHEIALQRARRCSATAPRLPLRHRRRRNAGGSARSRDERARVERRRAFPRDARQQLRPPAAVRAHLFVLASVTAENGDQEGTPVALIEAQACGLPVVSTLHSGIPEVVLDGQTGLLVPEGDVDALAGAIVRIAAEPELWPRLGAAGRAHVEATFDVAPCTEQLLAVYECASRAYARSSELAHNSGT